MNTVSPLEGHGDDQGEVATGIAGILAEILGIDPATVKGSDSLKDDLGVDSLSMVELAIAVEQRWGVRVPDDRFRSVVTVEDVAEFVEGLLTAL